MSPERWKEEKDEHCNQKHFQAAASGGGPQIGHGRPPEIRRQRIGSKVARIHRAEGCRGDNCTERTFCMELAEGSF